MSADAEAVAVVTGVLDPDPPTRDTFGAASAVSDAWDGRLRKWVRGKDTKPFKLPPKRDVAKTRAQLRKVLTDTQQAELVAAFQTVDPVLGANYLGVVQQAREYLLDLYPLVTLDSAMGPEELPPAADDAARWLAVVAVVEDMTRLVDEIEMGSLEPAQALAVRTCYPELFREVYGILTDELAKMRAQGRKGLPFDREATIRTLGGLGFDEPILPPVDAPVPPEQPKGKLDVERQQAPAEKLLRPLG